MGLAMLRRHREQPVEETLDPTPTQPEAEPVPAADAPKPKAKKADKE